MSGQLLGIHINWVFPAVFLKDQFLKEGQTLESCVCLRREDVEPNRDGKMRQVGTESVGVPVWLMCDKR